jgi:hypothetical protein
MDAAPTTRTASRGRTLAFRIVAAVVGLFGLGGTLPFAIAGFTSADQEIHRLHNVAGALSYGVLLGVSLLACAWRPERSLGPFWVAVASAIATTAAGLVAGDFISGIYFTAPITLVILLWLHPSRAELLPRRVDPATAVLALVALVPATAFALTQARFQTNAFPGDPHAELHHYSAMAITALALPLAAFAAALVVPGRRLAAWLVGIVGAGLGVASLALSDHIGAVEPPWAWLAIIWGVAIVAAVELGERRGASTQ